jgi:hypothetical protein
MRWLRRILREPGASTNLTSHDGSPAGRSGPESRSDPIVIRVLYNHPHRVFTCLPRVPLPVSRSPSWRGHLWPR